MPEQVPLTELIPGTKYTLEVSDCCFEGTITGVFKAYVSDEDGDPDEAVFDFGTIGPLWGQWTATPCLPPSEG